MLKTTRNTLLGLCFVLFQSSITAQVTKASANNNDYISKDGAIESIEAAKEGFFEEINNHFGSILVYFLEPFVESPKSGLKKLEEDKDYAFMEIAQHPKYLAISKSLQDFKNYADSAVADIKKKNQGLSNAEIRFIMNQLEARYKLIKTKLSEFQAILNNKNFQQSFRESVENAKSSSNVKGAKKP